jgi:hypothetical protein
MAFTLGIRYLWPLRVPLSAALMLAGLPYFAFQQGVRPFLSGLFDPIEDPAALLITTLALFNAWTILIISGLILAYGSTRLDLPPSGVRLHVVRPLSWAGSSVLAFPVIGCTVWYANGAADRSRTLGLLVYVLLGVALAVVMLVAVILTGKALADERSLVRRHIRPLEAAYRWLLDTLRGWPSLAAGFLRSEATPDGHARLAPGHGLAFGLACASVFLYVLTGFVTRNVQRPELASALAYVLLLQLMLTWLTGVAAFLFDRWRVPLVVLLLAWIVVVNTVIHRVFSTDHIYRTVTMDSTPPPLASPSDLLSGEDRPIVVAASGGGIQAAAWTARVLTGLRDVPGFASNLRLISAVSGGAVGAMNVLAADPDCGPPRTVDEARPPAFDPDAASRESSLHAAGWGLVFKDLPRSIVPFFSNPFVDRGSLLEDAWKREARLKRPYPDRAPLLSSWRLNVPERRCPGVIYNAMAAETGDPMLFSTVGLPRTLAAFDFYERYPGRDLPALTAVRLSSTFPYVSPASRADADDQKHNYVHVVDGGYFDNYGVSPLAAVVHAGLSAAAAAGRAPRRLLIVEICDSNACSGAEPPPRPSAGGGDRAWPYQIVAPLNAVVAMRAAAQRTSNRTALRLLKDYWTSRNICLDSIQVPFGEDTAPLSWHLTAVEKRAVDTAWTRMAAQSSAAVADFLAGRTPDGAACR